MKYIKIRGRLYREVESKLDAAKKNLEQTYRNVAKAESALELIMSLYMKGEASMFDVKSAEKKLVSVLGGLDSALTRMHKEYFENDRKTN